MIMNSCKIFPVPLSGSINVPGDKSISQRIALLSSIAYGESHIYGYLNGKDASSTLDAVEALGAKVIKQYDGSLIIYGTNGKFTKPKDVINLGNSGTGSRLLAGLLSGCGVEATIVGDESLSSRPMLRIKEPLEMMGANITLTGERGTLPMRISGGNLSGINFNMPIASAQVKSSIMFAALYANGITKIIEPIKSRDHTERLFKLFGIPVDINDLSISIRGYGLDGPKINGKEIYIPGDFSSSAFWLIAAAARPGAHIQIRNLGLNKRRIALLDVLKRMGADIHIKSDNSNYDPIGSISINGSKLKGTIISGDEIPNLIDEIPIIAVAGVLAEGQTIIRDASELRVKESDRIHEMVKNLKAFGVKVEEKNDGMIIYGSNHLITPDYPLQSSGDHRIAMSLAILNTYSNKELIINDIDCVDTSYPDFWESMKSLGGIVEK